MFRLKCKYEYLFKGDGMKKEKYIDESFKLGPLEVSRSGKLVSMKNVGSEEEYNEFIKVMGSEYKDTSLEIDSLVNEIKDMVSTCNPLGLLKYAYNKFITSIGGISSEAQLTTESVYVGRGIEYIQSVLVSSSNKHIKNEDKSNNLKKFELITLKIVDLYRLIQNYYMYRTANLKNESDIEFDLEQEQFLVEAQLSMFVRGDRYQIYEILHIKELLEPHNDEFINLYNITTHDFVKGLSNIQKSLTSILNQFDNIFGAEGGQIFEIMKMFEKYEAFEKVQLKKDENQTMDNIMKKFKEKEMYNLDSYKFKEKNEYKAFDLEELTNWPKTLLEDLSYKVGENEYFYNNEYPGWPLIELPVYERPFINIEGKFYCFDYYNLFDNIYRVIQRVFREKDLSYKDTWGMRQMEVTERMVSELYKKILPNCTVYTSNYYPKNKSLKNCAENDILILYDDNLIIVEVKAGSYTYRSPILDIDSHVSSLKTLVEKADGQAERTLDYLKSAKTVKLYNKDKSEKCDVTIDDFNEVTLMCITLDNFNEFSSKIEKMKFLKINKNTIALSIDDFRVYSDYFDSPLVFLHYLKQRKLATQNKALYLNDELDHLGMYIEHNMYAYTFKTDEESKTIAYGYRENVDEYFSSLVNKEFKIDKPKQKMPVEFEEIITCLDKTNLKERVRLAIFLLDFSSDAKNDLINQINMALIRQKQIGRMLALSLFGETPLCVFCHQYGIENIVDNSAKEYTLATMLESNDEFRIELHLFYDESEKVTEVKFYFYTIDNIPKEREAEFIELGHKYYNTRLISYKKQNNIKKIGRNDTCLCGSGKKYKKCHGK